MATSTSLWLTSRSAHEAGTQNCPMYRYLSFHAGPYSYGYQRRALSLPLVTGTYVDKPLSAICGWLIEAYDATGVQPVQAPDDVIRWAASLAVQKYRAVVEKRGILTLAADDPESLARLNTLINEQCALIEGLVWAFCLVRLPAILTEYRLRAVQTEESFVSDCSCGLGDLIGGPEDHAARGCLGTVMMSRPDLLASRWSDGAWTYIEFKTASSAKRGWNATWERKQQFLLGMLGAERRLGVEITHAWVEGLIKGTRKRDYGVTDMTAPKKQQNSLCYARLRLGNPGLTSPDWKPSYEYYDIDGIKHRCGRDYLQVALWEAPDDAFPGLPPGMSRSEWWVKYLLNNHPTALAKSLSSVGPIPKTRSWIDKALRSSIAEERIWKDRLWQVYDFSVATGKAWGDPGYMEYVETVIPRSWDCDRWGPDHGCAMQPFCFDWEGSDQPIESRLFVYRSPHHAMEAQAMQARGLEPTEGMGYEPDEDDGEWE